MTEKEFFQQVWRPYDTVILENGIKGRVANVCFPTRSVRINMPSGSPEWFRCELVTEHKSATGETTDLAIIEELHGKLMRAEQRIEELEGKLRDTSLTDIMRGVNIITASINEKKKRILRIEEGMQLVEAALEKMNEK